MNEVQFVARRAPDWDAWDRWLGGGEALPAAQMPAGFRALCQDLALAEQRNYSGQLVDALQRRVLAAHQRVYGARQAAGWAWLRFLAYELPAAVRARRRSVAVAGLLFFLPAMVWIVLQQYFPDAVYLLLSPNAVRDIESMYDPAAAHLGRPREASTAWMMWGHYIGNNVRIDFQCFAGGMAFGAGAVFFLLYNGMFIGAVAGHLTQIGFIDTFWGFVAGHSAFELTGAVLSGAAGLELGMALIAPGRRTRADALLARARGALPLIAGAAMLTFLAAFIEAFWSPLRGVPFAIKQAVGAMFWLLLALYFGLAGRGGDAA
ncbi:MAG: stage II sporulation protein M [Rhodocyclaceae bacterium]|nr:stage II sporulation protein M [Rhodocyclaceae bacterium]MBX3669946.1 stage II sporulation protein M [Rhodocyclaceae bacterium]